MAESEDSATVLTILKSLDETVKTLKADNKCLLNRIEILEAPPQNSGVVKQVLSGAEPNSEDQNRDVFEASETMMESDEEVDLQINSFSCQTKVGPKLGAQLAKMLDSDLVGQTDVTQIAKIRDEHPRPENVVNLRVPKLNEEIVLTDNDKNKESILVGLQQEVTTALILLAELMDDQSRTNHKFTRQDIFSKANDVTSILMHTHKEITLARKQNVKSVLQSGLHNICTKQYMKETDRCNNHVLFEEDLGVELDRNIRKKRIINKISKNFRGGNRRFPQQAQKYRYQTQFPQNTSRGRGALRGGEFKRGRGRGLPHPQSRGRGKSSKM